MFLSISHGYSELLKIQLTGNNESISEASRSIQAQFELLSVRVHYR